MANINKNKPIKTAELKSGDIFQFLSEGEWKSVDFSKSKDGSNVKEVCEFDVSLNGEDPRKYVINTTSADSLSHK